MDKEFLQKLIEEADKKQYEAWRNYQDTGNGRYYNTYSKWEKLRDLYIDLSNQQIHIERSKHLSSMIKQWNGIIVELPYCEPKIKEEKINTILNDIRNLCEHYL